MPWYAKLFAALVVGYAFSPIDLIPDFIPVLGYLDDLIIIPVGTALAVRMIPGSVMVACRQQAELNFQGQKSVNWVVGGGNSVGVGVIVVGWVGFKIYSLPNGV